MRAAWLYAGLVAVAFGAVAVGCGDEAAAPGPGRGAASSSIVLGPDGATLWVTSPDDDALVEVDAQTLRETRRFDIEGAPEDVALTRDGASAVVTLAQSSDLAVVLLATGEVTRVPTPCGGTRGVVVHEDTGLAYVSCPNDDRILELGLAPATLLRDLPAPGRPTALALDGDALAFTASRTGEIHTWSLPDMRETSTSRPATPSGRAAVQMDSIALMPDGTHLTAYQRVDFDSDRERSASTGGYGSVFDGNPRIEPRLHGACGGRYARFDGGVRVFSGPSAIAAGGDVVWVVHRYTDTVAAIDCSDRREPDDEAPVLAAWRVGRGPRGIALSPDGRTAFVDEGFDHAVARLTLENDGALHTAEATERRATTAVRFSAAGLTGRSLFHDAVDTHLTPSGIVTCATCHPGGGEDGLVWFLHTETVGPKLRRTPPAWAARRALEPFHWDGALPDGAMLARGTIQQLMEGDALLVDVDAIATYLDEAPAPPPRPIPEARRTEAELGGMLFADRCASCHTGALTSDAMTHSVLAPATDAFAQLDAADTPTLAGVRTHPPYLHDGRAATLRDVLTTHNPDDRHGRASDLSPADLDALLLYLETL